MNRVWEARERSLNRTSTALAFTALIMVLLRYGFPSVIIPRAVVTVWAAALPTGLFLESLARLLWAPDPWRYLVRHPLRYAVLLMILLELAGVSALQTTGALGTGSASFVAGELFLSVMLLAFAGHWIRGALVANRWLSGLRVPVSLLPALTFGLGILLGAAVLSLPGLHTRPIGPLDSLFTATSAVCVTGLTVFDVGQSLTPVGQFLLALLIQLGGLGIMTTLGMLLFWHGGQLSWGERVAFGELFGGGSLRHARRLLGRVARLAILVEAAGALALWLAWRDRVSHPLLQALFHSISAFCNAGFSLFPDSLTAFAGDTLTVVTVASLLIVGGLGFPVLADLARSTGSRLLPWKPPLPLGPTSRVVLRTSAVLLAIGTAAFLVEGWVGGRARSALQAFFQAATTRTAGFHLEGQLGLGAFGFWMTMILMVIGASPQSTGGGIKTTVIARLLGGAVGTRWLALLCIAGYVAFGLLGMLVIAIADPVPWRDALFEAFSALGTVGLSREVTPRLGTASKLVVILLMFSGRVLYPALVIYLVRRRRITDAVDWT